MYGQASAFGGSHIARIGAGAFLLFRPILPYSFLFAAWRYDFVVVEKVIPETHKISLRIQHHGFYRRIY